MQLVKRRLAGLSPHANMDTDLCYPPLLEKALRSANVQFVTRSASGADSYLSGRLGLRTLMECPFLFAETRLNGGDGATSVP